MARLDFLGGYLPSLNINYVAMNEDMEKTFQQLYYIKMKISYDLGFIKLNFKPTRATLITLVFVNYAHYSRKCRNYTSSFYFKFGKNTS